MNKWLWKIILIPAFLILIFGLIGLLFPYPYINFYLSNSAEISFQELNQTLPNTASLLEIIFRANGLGMTMSSILAIFIIFIPFRKNEKWSIYALALVGGIGLIGEIILEFLIL